MKCVHKCGEAPQALAAVVRTVHPLAVTDRQKQFRLAHQSNAGHSGRKYDAPNGKYIILLRENQSRFIIEKIRKQNLNLVIFIVHTIKNNHPFVLDNKKDHAQSISGCICAFWLKGFLKKILQVFRERKGLNCEHSKSFFLVKAHLQHLNLDDNFVKTTCSLVSRFGNEVSCSYKQVNLFLRNGIGENLKQRNISFSWSKLEHMCTSCLALDQQAFRDGG